MQRYERGNILGYLLESKAEAKMKENDEKSKENK